VSAAASPEGGGHEVGAEQIAAMTEKLAAHLKEQPDDAQGWAMLARSYSVVGRNDDALPAYQKAVALAPDDSRLLADYADALAVKNNRNLEGEPTRLVERALKIDPDNIKALALAGTAAFDRKDYTAAVSNWEKLVRIGPTDPNFVQQVQAGIAEARSLGKLPPAAVGTDAPATVPQVAAGGVSGNVSLSPALAAKAGPDDTVFVYARAAEGSRMPLAIVRKQVRDLPFEFKLDDSMAMSPAAKLSGAPKVIVGARVSKTGQAMPSPGDLTGQTAPMAPSGSGLKIVIDEVVK
jgi:cytochrome c-type biogenesis protein CcmH